jgi:hypothetical protein
MVIPRSWTAIMRQHTPAMKEDIARPAATNARGKAGAIFAAVAWLVIIFSLNHSLRWYKPRTVGMFRKINAFCRDCPTKLFIAIILLGVRIGYGIASAWLWDLSILKDDVAVYWPMALGYGPILLIIVVFEIAGFVEENEDKKIMEQRRARGQMYDRELGIVHKPSWWDRHMGDRFKSDQERLKNMTTEVGGGRPTARSLEQSIEMGNMNIRNRSASRPIEDPFRDQSPSNESRQSSVAPARLGVGRMDSDAASARTDNSRATGLTGMTLTGENAGAQQPQRIRSMLDI